MSLDKKLIAIGYRRLDCKPQILYRYFDNKVKAFEIGENGELLNSFDCSLDGVDIIVEIFNSGK